MAFYLNLSQQLQQLNNNSTTNAMILDYLFYQSIQSRLQKALTFDDETEYTKDKNVIESVIEGILSSNKKNKNKKMSAKFEQRLNLCQLTNLTMGRTHHITFSAPVRRHKRDDEVAGHNEQLFSKPFSPAFCRRHRRPNCSQSPCLLAKTGGPGLAEAIPAFLKTSANMLRSVLDNNHGDIKPLTVAGQQVMGGGMPPRWYDLFLDLLTQAAIQSYMCDGRTGLETIYEIFSYGYVEDEDEEDYIDEEEDEEECHEEEEEEDQDNIWNVKAADHHLLFPKTRTMYLFKLQVRQREKEFIQIKPGYTLEKHFQELEKQYPLIYFERNMCDFIQMILEDMDIPALDKCDTMPDICSPIKSPEDLPEPHFIYKYPEDGSLLMPEMHDEDDTVIPMLNDSRKRSTYEAGLLEETHCKQVRH
ncbi:uncharacterized protein B0P05DRAFT_524563 [Gilbertella persicaria]|uniref:uncharacterized protein n=1 Tax=Gilbertella persicaria TaxID=101096 RepID=UPI002220B98B|nr:uncharacterized protein B0P05DRAFT_524563 [Gilbertella persicaria]KAI8095066.1 hypothetical protein B0P05DRAFT_524563 [Gilbertella persicaria]